MLNALFYGDNLDVLREHIANESVDLIYLDPPFNSNATYNVLFRAPAGQQSEAQIEAFEDTWHWGDSAARAFDEVIRSRHTEAATMLHAMRSFLGENDVMAYLAMMAVRLIELHRVLKPTGSLYLHCDPKASHYLKLLLDAVFGRANLMNEIIWKRTHAHGSSKRYGPVHDVIFFYTKSNTFVWTDPRAQHAEGYVERHFTLTDETTGVQFAPITLTGSGVRHGESGKPWKGINPTDVGRHWALPGAILEDLGISSGTIQERLDGLDEAGRIFWPKAKDGTPRLKWFVTDLHGVAIPDVWIDIPPISAHAKERLGYPTQKPLALLERIIAASSNESDLVLDPFCGCGTAVHAAQKLNRRWIGIDITHLAISLIERRLKDAFPEVKFEVHGVPRDLGGARDLASRDKYQFQWWAVSLVDAVPQGGKKKGADRGIDGIRWVRTGPREGDVDRVIVSVKGGEHVTSGMVRDLKGTVEREGAAAGLIITLAEPTREMEREAAASGFFESGLGRHPRIQAITIRELLGGIKPDLLPLGRSEGFRRAPRERGPKAEQGRIEL